MHEEFGGFRMRSTQTNELLRCQAACSDCMKLIVVSGILICTVIPACAGMTLSCCVYASFLYFTRCGLAASSPMRRFLSASYSL